MAKKKLEKKDIRKYVNWILFLIAIVLVCLISSKLYGTYQTNKLKTSVLSRVVGTIQIDDIKNAQRELASEDFIFISYVKSQEVSELETKLKSTIVDNDLQNNFYYLDATDLMMEENYIDVLNTKLSLPGKGKIEALPALIYYKNGEYVKTITSTKTKMMSADDFNMLLDNYEVLENK